MLEIKNLTKVYDNDGKPFTAIKDVSFDVEAGEIVCIVGPSGSGKSSILKCLTGIDSDYEGSIKIHNKKSVTYLGKNKIALVSQKYSSFPWLTVHENVAIGFYGSNLSPLKIEKSTDALLKRVGLFKAKDYFMSKLSGGMQQRVAIARSIAQGTDIIAFDEPFGALDVQARSQMQEFLAKLWEEEKKTMILVTHDIDEAIYLANRIFVLGTAPGTIKKVVEVNIKRPRKPEIRFQDDFVQLKKYINYIIRSESIKANLEEGLVSDDNILKMGLPIFSGHAPLYYAKDSGLFVDEALDVEQINFDDNEEKVNLWVEGKLDVISVTLDQAIELHATIPDLKILSVLNSSVGGDALIVKDSITSVAELKGKTIGLEKGSAAVFLLSYILDKAGMSLKDITIKDMQSGEIGAEIISGGIDGGILWEPWLDKALELSNMSILKSTKDYPVLYDVLIVQNENFQKKKEEFRKIAKVWGAAVTQLEKQKDEVISVSSSHIGIPERELSDFLEKIVFFGTTPKNISTVAEDIQRVLIKEKKIEKFEDPKSFLA